MMTVNQIAQHVLSLDPQRNPARLAFYHFLKNMLPLQSAFGAEMMDAFYDRALSLQYWQSHKEALGQMISDDLAAIATRYPLGFDVKQIVHSHEMQVVNLEQTRDFAALLAKDITRMEKNDEKVKSFRLYEEKKNRPQDVLIVRLQKNGRIIAEVRQNIAILVEGQLHLVRPHSVLTYTADLDFDANVDQFLTTSLMKVAHFVATGRNAAIMKGNFIQGASFHRSESFERPLDGIPELFQAVKNLERFFINPVTDPYYHQMMENFGQAFNEKGITI